MNDTVKEKILNFRDCRDWKQFHNGKDLAISLSLEAAELLECFQWSAEDVNCIDKIEDIKEELADIFTYAVLIADSYNLDINDIIMKKIAMNEKKYPIDKAKGKKDKYTELK